MGEPLRRPKKTNSKPGTEVSDAIKSGIYQIENAVTSKVYVGSAVGLSRRWISHRRDLRRGNHTNRKLQHSWNKHGESVFRFSVLEYVADKQRLLEREQFWLDKTKSPTIGYNIAATAGSLLGMKFSDETRSKMSAARKGRKLSPEHIAKTREALLGRKMTLEQRQKMRDARLGRKFRPHSAETRAKMSLAAKGRKKSVEHVAKIAASLRGRKQPPEMIAKRANALRAYWAERLADRAFSRSEG